MIIGPEDSGKTSIAKLLLNYAVRMQETPLFADLDPHEATITVPGTLSVTPITHAISIEDSWIGYAEASSNAPPATPIVWQFGHEQPTDNVLLYKLLVDRVAQSIDLRLRTDRLAAGSGFVVDTRGVSDASKYEVLEYAAEKLKINVLIVVGNERMYSAFSSKMAGVTVVKLAKSGGVVDREPAFRRQYNSRIVRQYFYGTSGNPVSSYSTITNFDDILVVRIGEDARAPSSTLPLGESRMVTDTSVLEVTPDESLSHSILAVTDARRDEAREGVVGMQALGFVSVTGVDMAKKRLTLLAPVPGRLQKPVLLYGGIKWMET
ncbi:Cleavage polyadenylation factor subunit clp1 [Linderina pennispora]|nr:Cleavage polyadenylation factor subunit clp1 [Linderina pennispora]